VVWAAVIWVTAAAVAAVAAASRFWRHRRYRLVLHLALVWLHLAGARGLRNWGRMVQWSPRRSAGGRCQPQSQTHGRIPRDEVASTAV
jgi:hypothetical protein